MSDIQKQIDDLMIQAYKTGRMIERGRLEMAAINDEILKLEAQVKASDQRTINTIAANDEL
jgi:hypothetical protein